MSSNPKFTVLIPYYNSILTIEETLLSVFNQTYIDYEVVLVNDFSNDYPAELIKAFKEKFRQLGIAFEYYEMSVNSGPSFTRNFGWDLAKGEYICFLDSDDLWHPEKLNVCSGFIDEYAPALLFHNSDVSKTGKLIEILDYNYSQNRFEAQRINPVNWLIKNLSVTPAVVVRKDISLRFNEEMKYCEDYDLWLRIAFKYNDILRINGSPLTFLGKPFMGGNGLSSNILKMRIGEIRLYTTFCFTNYLYLPLFPLLITSSLIKHIRLIIFVFLIKK